MKTHYWADEFPLNQEDIDALAENIKAEGQRHPILTLKDGTILDGRNRWLACESIGIDPMVEVVNPDGKELTDHEIFRIVTSENNMRRDNSNSNRAVQAARAWKRLYPEGAPKSGRPKKGESNPEIRVTSFQSFARDHFKIKKDSAEKALAIVNFGLERLESTARISLDSGYSDYQKLKAEEMERQMKIDQLMTRDDCADLRERVDGNGLSIDEAIVIMMDRTKKERERKEARERATRQLRETISGFARFRCVDDTMDVLDLNHAGSKWLAEIAEKMPESISALSDIYAATKAAIKTNK